MQINLRYLVRPNHICSVRVCVGISFAILRATAVLMPVLKPCTVDRVICSRSRIIQTRILVMMMCEEYLIKSEISVCGVRACFVVPFGLVVLDRVLFTSHLHFFTQEEEKKVTRTFALAS